MDMDEYPNPDEEYEMLYQEEMEALREMEEEVLKEQQRRPKNSLNFDSPSLDKENVCNESIEINVTTPNRTPASENNKKRCLSSEFLADINSDLDIVERPSKKHKANVQEEVRNHECGITSARIPKWPFISVSTDLGEKLYVKLNPQSSTSDANKYIYNNSSNSGLLVTPYNRLKRMAEDILKKKEKEATNQIVNLEDNSAEESDLWVEKYKPKTYFDLLSDEAVNRTLLNWLKMWDKVVFNKEVKSKSKDDQIGVNSELDKDGRPRFKIALLCGPPGLGKTTLAHIAAGLAGYSVIEVNASDDRTIESISTKLDAATKIQSVMGDRKPYCLILDEIDGAPAPTVDFLLRYLSGRNSEKSKKGKKEKPIHVVKRPIICICNELYTPSLRQLRQQAFVVHFPHTSSTKLAQRLLEICRKQDIKTDLSTLTLLCDKAQNDIRSCISTLYFFKNKSGQRFKSVDVINSSVGQKDIQKGMFSLWKEIFHIPVRRGNFFSNVIEKGKEEVSSNINYSRKAMDKLHHIVHVFQSAGDHERLLQGVFENFPKSKFSGSADSLAVALQWFTWFDLLDSNIKREQNFILMPYLPYGFAAWHCLFSSNNFWKISYPSVGYESHLKEMRSKQILNDFLRGLNASVRSHHPRNAVLLDVLPMFNFILNPPIRSVNPTLFNESEKKDFKQLIDVMIEYGLNFIQQRSIDGTYFYQYDTNIEELSRFNVTTSGTIRSFSYSTKQIISHEIELERVRRAEEKQPRPPTPTESKTTQDKNKSKKAEILKVAPAKAAGKKMAENEMQYKDFFGRVVKIRDAVSDGGKADKNEPVKSPIWFSFKEGYNNAVKKDVTIADLL